MPRRITMFGLIIFYAVLVFAALPLAAQDGPDDEEGRRRVEDLRRVKLIEALDLNEEQSVRLLAREKDFREKERQAQERRKTLFKTLEGKIDEKASDEVLREHILKLHESGLEMQNLRRDYLFSLGDILTMQQIARMVVFEQRFMQEVRSLIQRYRRGGRSGR
jgi:hypothetical protein